MLFDAHLGKFTFDHFLHTLCKMDIGFSDSWIGFGTCFSFRLMNGSGFQPVDPRSDSWMCTFKMWFLTLYMLMSKTSCNNLYISSEDIEIYCFWKVEYALLLGCMIFLFGLLGSMISLFLRKNKNKNKKKSNLIPELDSVL